MTGPAHDAKRHGNPRIIAVALNELLALQLGAARGEDFSRHMAEVAIATVLRVNSAPESRPARCVHYSGAIRLGDRYLICVLLEGNPESTADAGVAICNCCGASPAALSTAWTVLDEAARKSNGGGRT
jgi:hypothetical protein